MRTEEGEAQVRKKNLLVEVGGAKRRRRKFASRFGEEIFNERIVHGEKCLHKGGSLQNIYERREIKQLSCKERDMGVVGQGFPSNCERGGKSGRRGIKPFGN